MIMGKCPHPPNIAGEFWGKIEVVCITFFNYKVDKNWGSAGMEFPKIAITRGRIFMVLKTEENFNILIDELV